MDDLRKHLIAASAGPESRSIGKMELCQAPLLGGLAIGWRCVFRTEPLLTHFDDDPEKDTVDRLFTSALQATADFVQGRTVRDLDGLIEAMDGMSSRTIKRGQKVARATYELLLGIRYALEGDGVMAASSSATAIMLSMGDVPRRPDEEMSDVAKVLSGQSRDIGPNLMRDVVADDYENLAKLGLGAFPELGKPIVPTASGPLGPFWPDGAPDWYPT